MRGGCNAIDGFVKYRKHAQRTFIINVILTQRVCLLGEALKDKIQTSPTSMTKPPLAPTSLTTVYGAAALCLFEYLYLLCSEHTCMVIAAKRFTHASDFSF